MRKLQKKRMLLKKMKLRQKLHTVKFTLKKSKFTINIFHCWTRWFQCWKNVLLCTGQSQKPTIGENCSKYFLLMLTVMLQNLQSSSLKKCKILLIYLKSNGIGRQLRIRDKVYVLQIHWFQQCKIRCYIGIRSRRNGKVSWNL